MTTVEQAVLDLAHRPSLGHAIDDAQAAILALLPRCNDDRLDHIAGRQRLKSALARTRLAIR